MLFNLLPDIWRTLEFYLTAKTVLPDYKDTRESPACSTLGGTLSLSLSLSQSTHHGRIPGIAADAALAAVGPPLATETPAV